VSQAARIAILVTRRVKAHRGMRVCKPVVRTGSKCPIPVARRTTTRAAAAGSNTFKLALAGLGKGSYMVTITAENANGNSTPVRLTFAITHK
jgi:hypothetical protein